MSDIIPAHRGVLDTNTLILLPRLRDARQLPAVPAITTISLAELSVGPLLAAARAFGHVAADLRQVGAEVAVAPCSCYPSPRTWRHMWGRPR